MGGVLDSCGKFVKESADNSFGGFYEIDVQNVENANEEVIFWGVTIAHWGTFLVDFTRRLYYYFLAERKIKIAFCGVSFEQGTFGNITNHCYLNCKSKVYMND